MRGPEHEPVRRHRRPNAPAQEPRASRRPSCSRGLRNLGRPGRTIASAAGTRWGCPQSRLSSQGRPCPAPDAEHTRPSGELETVLLTVAMAAEENRMLSADPDEAARILAFPARLAEHDAMLLSPPNRAGFGTEGPVDGAGAGDGAPDPG
jgi:hypothetical protein